MDLDIDMRTIFANLPEEKQQRIARKLVREQLNNPMVHTVVLMPKMDEDGTVDESVAPSASGLNMKQIVEEHGEDYAVGLMTMILKNGGVSTKVMDKESIDALLRRCADGTASPEEYAMANIMIQQIQQRFNRNDGTILCTKILLDLLHYCKQKQGIQMYYGDIMNSVFLMMLGSMINMDDTPMARFRNCGPQQCVTMAEKIADDIDKALNDSIFSKGAPNNQFMALALYALAMRYATRNEFEDKMMFADAKLLNDLFGMDNEFEDYSKDDEEKSEESD